MDINLNMPSGYPALLPPSLPSSFFHQQNVHQQNVHQQNVHHTLHRTSGILPAIDHSITKPEGSLRKKLKKDSRLLSKGMENFGNSCFMNATVQCLLNSDIFVENLEKHPHMRCGHYPDCTACSLLEQYIHSQASTYPFVMYRQLPRLIDGFQFGEQQDPYDLLCSVLMKFSYKIRNVVFDFKVHKSITCPKCNRTAEKVTPFEHLNLPINDSSILSVQDAVNAYFRKRMESNYTCTLCSQKRNAEKVVYLKSLPAVLIIRLGRFKDKEKVVKKSLQMSKTLSFETHPLEGSQCNQLSSTSLKAVLMHSGSEHLRKNCHYYCYLRRGTAWYKFDDLKVTKQSWDEISEDMARNAYLLFYHFETEEAQLCHLSNQKLPSWMHDINVVPAAGATIEEAPIQPISKKSYNRLELRNLLTSKDNKLKSWILIQIGLNCFNEKNNNRAKFLRDSLIKICPQLKVRSNSSEDWKLVKNQSCFFNKICNVIQIILKYGRLYIKEERMSSTHILTELTTGPENTADIFSAGLSERVQNKLDPSNHGIYSLVKVGETQESIEKRRVSAKANNGGPPPMAWDFAVFLAIEFLRTGSRSRAKFFEEKMQSFSDVGENNSAKEEISKNSSLTYFNTAVAILEIVRYHFRYLENPIPEFNSVKGANFHHADLGSDESISSEEDYYRHPIDYKMKKLIPRRL